MSLGCRRICSLAAVTKSQEGNHWQQRAEVLITELSDPNNMYFVRYVELYSFGGMDLTGPRASDGKLCFPLSLCPKVFPVWAGRMYKKGISGTCCGELSGQT